MCVCFKGYHETTLGNSHVSYSVGGGISSGNKVSTSMLQLTSITHTSMMYRERVMMAVDSFNGCYSPTSHLTADKTRVASDVVFLC